MLTVVVPIAGGALVGLALAAAAHIGVRLQLRRRGRLAGHDKEGL
jgi:hypothetical protein